MVKIENVTSCSKNKMWGKFPKRARKNRGVWWSLGSHPNIGRTDGSKTLPIPLIGTSNPPPPKKSVGVLLLVLHHFDKFVLGVCLYTSKSSPRGILQHSLLGEFDQPLIINHTEEQVFHAATSMLIKVMFCCVSIRQLLPPLPLQPPLIVEEAFQGRIVKGRERIHEATGIGREPHHPCHSVHDILLWVHPGRSYYSTLCPQLQWWNMYNETKNCEGRAQGEGRGDRGGHLQGSPTTSNLGKECMARLKSSLLGKGVRSRSLAQDGHTHKGAQ